MKWLNYLEICIGFLLFCLVIWLTIHSITLWGMEEQLRGE